MARPKSTNDAPAVEEQDQTTNDAPAVEEQDQTTNDAPAVEESGLIRMWKDGETIEVHPTCVDSHRGAGWKVLE